MENNIFELQYALDTFYFLVMGALVMWMAAGFAMLEAGLVRSKSTTEILTKNIALFAIACTAYLVVGYELMYDGGMFLKDIALDGAKDAARPWAVRQRLCHSPGFSSFTSRCTSGAQVSQAEHNGAHDDEEHE